MSADRPASRLLVTGATGFVGTVLTRAVAARRPDLLVIGSGPDAPGAPVDLCRAEAVHALVRDARPDVVVHLAGQASVGAAQREAAEQTWRVNLAGTLNLALAVDRHAPDATVLFVSSSEVYGAAFGPQAVDEDVVPRPLNAYARSKLLAERVLADVLPATARLIVARPFNHSGPGQREAFVLPSFAAQVARVEAGLQPTVRVGNLDVARDFLDVRDVVAAYLALIEAAPRLPARFTCNVATGTARSLRAIVETLRGLARVPVTVEVDPERQRPSDVPYAAGDAARLRDATGWAPVIPFATTLADLLADARARTGTPVAGAA